MSDELIHLNCPNCGGPIHNEHQDGIIICPYCRQELILKSDRLESAGFCPVCHRADQSKKVSALAANTQPNSAAFAAPVRPEAPTPLPSPEIQQPAPPPARWVKILVLSLGLLTIGVALMLTLSETVSPSTGSATVCVGGAYLLAIVLVITFFLMRSREKKLKLAYVQELEAYDQQWGEARRRQWQAEQAHQSQYEQFVKEWQAFQNTWSQLYYCARDDCVFIPGRQTSAALADLKDYIQHSG